MQENKNITREGAVLCNDKDKIKDFQGNFFVILPNFRKTFLHQESELHVMPRECKVKLQRLITLQHLILSVDIIN